MENFPHLPTILSVAAAVIVLTLVLNRFLFTPLRSILDERQRRTNAAQDEFDRSRAVQEERLAEIEQRLKAARREAFEVRQAAQRAGRGQREALMGEARQEAHQLTDAARAELASDFETARQDLEAEADRLAEMIADRILGRPVGADGGKR